MRTRRTRLPFVPFALTLGVVLLSSCAQDPSVGLTESLIPPPKPNRVKAVPQTTPVKPATTGPKTSVSPTPVPSPSSSPSIQPSPAPGSLWPKKKATSPAPTEKLNPGTITGPAPLPMHGLLFTIFTRPFAQAFGVYDHGSLQKPDLLPNEGGGFVKVFRARERRYGTLDLTSLITNSAKLLRQDFPASERIQIGDISDPNGGPAGGHASHQNGLDADIVFLKKNHREMNPTDSEANATGFDEDFVDAHGLVSANFDTEANWKLIQLLVSTGRVDRIFIDSHLKRKFCEYAVERGMRADWTETLRKLRHWPNHQDHFHVRLACPEKSLNCRETSPLPSGDGCDAYLDANGHAKFGEFDAGPEETPDPNDQGC